MLCDENFKCKNRFVYFFDSVHSTGNEISREIR